MVIFSSAHSGYCVSDCADLSWGEQIKAVEKPWCPMQIYRRCDFLHTRAGRTPVWFCWLVAISGFAGRRHTYVGLMALTAWLLPVELVFPFLVGVQFDIDLPNKKVCIDSEHNIDTLLETLKKTGKNASYLGEKSAQ